MASPGEDQPIIVNGASHHITVKVRGSSARSKPKTFSITPKDPAVPFKEIVIKSGAKVIKRWPLSKNWKVTIG